MKDPTKTAAQFAEACDEAGILYAFIGGVAVAAWGRPRATTDIDVLIDLNPDQDAAFVTALRRSGLEIDARDLVDARRDRAHVTVFDPEDLWHLDLKLVHERREKDQVRRARTNEVAGTRLRISSPEDTLAYKLLFGSPLDLQDAAWIWRRQEGDLDLAYLRSLTVRLGVEDKLDNLIMQAAEDRGP